MSITEIRVFVAMLLMGGSGVAMGCENFEWSGNPGAYEANLIRRCNNPYFPAEYRDVGPDELVAARRIDSEDSLEAQNRFLGIGTELGQCGSAMSMAKFNRLRETLNDLIMFALGVGGPANAIADSATRLRDALIQDLRTANQGDPEALRAIQAAENFHQERVIPFREPIIAQLLRERSPIMEEHTIVAILSESPAAIAAFMDRLPEDSRPIIELEALTVLKGALDGGYIDPQLVEKIDAIQKL